MDEGRLPHLITKYQPCGKRSQGRPLKLLMETEQVTSPKLLQAI